MPYSYLKWHNDLKDFQKYCYQQAGPEIDRCHLMHSMWERKLGEIWQLTEQMRGDAEAKKKEQSADKPWRYTAEYAPLALWEAFDTALGRKAIGLMFKAPDNQLGLSYGANRIEESASTPEARLSIVEEYKEFIRSMSQASTMKQLANSWLEAGELEVQILTIADRMLKSGDIFYEYRFCRHLWA